MHYNYVDYEVPVVYHIDKIKDVVSDKIIDLKIPKYYHVEK